MLLSLKNSGDYAEALPLIAAVRANPQDDAPRLVLADWLDERHHLKGCKEWAELIRLQCSPAATAPADYFREGGSSEDYVNTHRRIAELMPQVAEMSGLLNYRKSYRGFFPLIKRFDHIKKNEFHAFFDQNPDWFFDISQVWSYADADDIRTLARYKNFPHVISLDLSSKYLYYDSIQALTQCHNLPHLTSLNLSSNGLGTLGIEALARCHNFPHLTELNLSANEIRQAGDIQALAQCTNFPQLTTLNLSLNSLRTDSIEALAQCTNFPHLTSLDLSYNQLCTNSIRALARCTNFPHLTTLNLGRNELDAASIEALAQCHNFPHLTSLNLSSNGLGTLSIQALARCHNFPHLTELNLSANEIRQAADMEALAQCTNFPNLTVLNLWGNRLHEYDIIPLIRAIAEGILPDATKGEVFPALQCVITSCVVLDQLFADAIAARYARLHPPQADVNLAEFQQHSPANEVV